jgi:hypothetical protein
MRVGVEVCRADPDEIDQREHAGARSGAIDLQPARRRGLTIR